MRLYVRNLEDILDLARGSDDFIEISDIVGDSGASGQMNSFYGRKHSEHTKKLLSDIMKEKMKDEEFKNKRIRRGESNGMFNSARFGELNPMFGKKHTEESKQKMRKKRVLSTTRSPRVMTEEMKLHLSEIKGSTIELKKDGKLVVIKNIKKYAKENNLNPTMLSRVYKGIAKNHRGYTK